MSFHYNSLFLKGNLGRQQGQTFLVLIIIIVLGSAAAIYSFVSSNRLLIDADQQTAAALVQAKEALIGYAATHATRPGTLPSPDTTNDGQTDSCSTTPCIGRLPWKSLGLPDLRDGNGERLWYAVSNGFKSNPSTGVLNSDTAGDFTVNGTTGVIAVIFSPGAITGSQLRDAANINNVASYLDGGNEAGGITFTTSGTTNDKLLLITKENLFPSVEQRVVREIGENLQLHYSSNRYYPYPAPFGSTACDSTTPIYRGRIATSCIPPLSVVNLPPWFTPNRWNEVIVYSVAPKCTPRVTTTPDFAAIPTYPYPVPDLGKFCSVYLDLSAFGLGIIYICYPYVPVIDGTSLNCQNNNAGPLSNGPMLSIDGNSAQALLFSGGPGLTGQSRPCATAAACLENMQNSDGPSDYPGNVSIDGTDDFNYVTPKRSSANNDNLFIVGPSP